MLRLSKCYNPDSALRTVRDSFEIGQEVRDAITNEKFEITNIHLIRSHITHPYTPFSMIVGVYPVPRGRSRACCLWSELHGSFSMPLRKRSNEL